MTNNNDAKQRYAARLASITRSLERLRKASAENFSVAPENANWCDVTLAHDIDEKLKEICDRVFKEGECAR